jgi:hypothetical protein
VARERLVREENEEALKQVVKKVKVKGTNHTKKARG